MTSPQVVRKPWYRIEIITDSEAPVSTVVMGLVNTVGAQHNVEFTTYSIGDETFPRGMIEFYIEKDAVDLNIVVSEIAKHSREFSVRLIQRWTLVNDNYGGAGGIDMS